MGEFGKSQGVDLEKPKSAPDKQGETTELETSIAASNSFSMFISGYGFGDFSLGSRLHPARPGVSPIDFDPTRPTKALESQAPKSFTSFRKDFVRMQTKLPKSKRKEKEAELGLVSGAKHKVGKSIGPKRDILHTEAQWFHSAEYQKALADVVTVVSTLLVKFISKDAVESWTDPDNAGDEAHDFDLTMALMSLPERTFDLVINRSSCTHKSGYGGGCAQEHADMVESFWDYAETNLGRLARILRPLGKIKFRVSFAGRDTAATDKTFSVPSAVGIESSILPKLDLGAKQAQGIDRNQFDALKALSGLHEEQRKRRRTDVEGMEVEAPVQAQAHPVDVIAKQVRLNLEIPVQALANSGAHREIPLVRLGPAVAALFERALAQILVKLLTAFPALAGEDEFSMASLQQLVAALGRQISAECFGAEPLALGAQVLLLQGCAQAFRILDEFCDQIADMAGQIGGMQGPGRTEGNGAEEPKERQDEVMK
jgi:hypothetical protein